ncbi:ImmA/IrrE family metallo-endopeptidase [Microvirga terrestris]|uniref:ImmA/IrrE family metallo-endopeptidase n=1 Tax=Microvirga terrestris TaxID=2791024 RepID=A0ABS0HW87_9HYPH|nr:ImmA/IrrE family metallo-endopeptidase [Microvirga terrestris]MBF9197773.1 ImmA/IrrE family metallo-endopeptidase [Microvirga terrestris]
MGKNYRAPHILTEATITKFATDHRLHSPTASVANFDIVRFFYEELQDILGHPVVLELRDLSGPDDDPAFVSFKPLKLVCDYEVWRNAKLGDPDARYVIAHELGHLVFHSGHELHFSSPDSVFHSWYPEHEGTEWQAHNYAEKVLLPDFVVKPFTNHKELAQACDVTEALALKRFREVNNIKFSGEPCPHCHDFTMAWHKNKHYCYKCG